VDLYKDNEGLLIVRDALLTLNKSKILESELEATKKICLSNLSFITQLMLDYASTPEDCINLLNRSQKIKNEILEI
tara:strand:+ start:8463 stop:8690 length:228 start_codon:yes stop_codon:yes gene_type:complete